MIGKKRDKMEIIHDILFVIEKKNGTAKQTQIMSKSNLSYKMMQYYLEDLLKKQFILEIGDKKKTYIITEKGKMFIQKYRSIKDFREAFGIDSEEF